MKKFFSAVIALVLVLGLAAPAFADSTTAPTSSTTVTSITGITSVTVAGTEAYYQKDNNTGDNVVYIRAKLPNTSTWEDLQSADVIISVTAGYSLEVSYNGSPISTPTPSNNAYTYEDLDLLNKRYAVTVSIGNNSYTYWLAAGFTGRVTIASSDILGIQSATLGSSSALSIYGNVVQNNYMGNTYYVNHSDPINWTDTNVAYYIAGTYTPNSGTTDAVNKTISFVSGATGASLTNNGCVNNNGTLNLSVSMSSRYIEVINNNLTRRYYISAILDPTTTFTVSESTYVIDFTELLSDPDYGEDFLENIEGILTALDGFYEYAGAHKVYFTWQSVMDVMLDFIDYANFSGETYCSSTYLSMLNGLGEFSAGSNSGWMYMDGEYEEDCSTPMVGAADYLLGDAPLFTWFFTTDYPSHF